MSGAQCYSTQCPSRLKGSTAGSRPGLTAVESIVRVGPLPPGDAEDLLEALLRSHAADRSAEDRDAMAQVHAVAGARVGYELALRISQRIGDPQGQANALLGLGKTDLMGEDFSVAQARTREAAQTYQKIDDGLGAADALVMVGDLALAQGQFAETDTAYADAEDAFTALSCPLNKVLVGLRRWPLEKKGSVFHGSLEMTGGGR